MPPAMRSTRVATSTHPLRCRPTELAGAHSGGSCQHIDCNSRAPHGVGWWRCEAVHAGPRTAPAPSIPRQPVAPGPRVSTRRPGVRPCPPGRDHERARGAGRRQSRRRRSPFEIGQAWCQAGRRVRRLRRQRASRPRCAGRLSETALGPATGTRRGPNGSVLHLPRFVSRPRPTRR